MSTPVPNVTDSPSCTINPTCDGEIVMLTNPVEGQGGVGLSHHTSWYAFVMTPNGVGNYIVGTTVDNNGNVVDGVDGAGGCPPLIMADQPYEDQNVKDAAVVKFRGCYMMAYVAGIPQARGDVLISPFDTAAGRVGTLAGVVPAGTRHNRKLLSERNTFPPMAEPAPTLIPPKWLITRLPPTNIVRPPAPPPRDRPFWKK